MSPKCSPRQQICLVCACSCAKRRCHDLPIAPGEVMTLVVFTEVLSPASSGCAHVNNSQRTYKSSIQKSLLPATKPSNSKISCKEEASNPPRLNKRPWNPGKNKSLCKEERHQIAVQRGQVGIERSPMKKISCAEGARWCWNVGTRGVGPPAERAGQQG
jgi:hypothetical protein